MHVKSDACVFMKSTIIKLRYLHNIIFCKRTMNTLYKNAIELVDARYSFSLHRIRIIYFISMLVQKSDTGLPNHCEAEKHTQFLKQKIFETIS